ncbi:hypothetical protein, partial [Flavobacterium branchiophilum]|uniref:hypothetical protein n=1 Tax=Flavobacterium branchiophilum TaxID=55197 RepID=UPI0039EDFB1B
MLFNERLSHIDFIFLLEFDEFYFPKSKVLAMLRNFPNKVSNIIGTSKAPQPPKGEFELEKYLAAATFGIFTQGQFPPYATIFLFLKKKQKGFPLQSGLDCHFW